MNTLATRIRQRLAALKMTKTELAKQSGVSKATVSLWCNGTTQQIDGENLTRAAIALAVDAHWLATGEGFPDTTLYHVDSNAEPVPFMAPPRRIPVVGTAQLGDNGYWSDLEYPPGHGDGFILLPTRDANAYAVRCRGDSMRPRIRDGEFVVVEPGSPPISGDEVLIRSRDGRVMVKTLLYIREGRVHLLSVNESHPPIAINEDEIEVMHQVNAIVKKKLWTPY